jgi:hypothetical protein
VRLLWCLCSFPAAGLSFPICKPSRQDWKEPGLCKMGLHNGLEKARFLGAAHTWVCCGSAGSPSPGKARAAPRPGQYTAPQPTAAGFTAKAVEVVRETHTQRPRRAAGPTALLRSDAPLHHSTPGAPAALPPTAPLLTRCASSREGCGCSACSACSASTPARSLLPLLAPGSAPGVSPARPSPGLPSPRCLRTPR